MVKENYYCGNLANQRKYGYVMAITSMYQTPDRVVLLSGPW
jgi:hypothetical protein